MIAFKDLHYTSFTHDRPQIHIRHKPEQGYPTAFNGQEIKEEMPLDEFLRRVYRDLNEAKHVEKRILHTLHNVVYRRLGHHEHEIDTWCKIHDNRYRDLIQSGKIVLAQHKHGMSNQKDDAYLRHQMYQQNQMRGLNPSYIGGIDPYSPSSANIQRRSDFDMKSPEPTDMQKAVDSEKKRAKTKRSDDLFYLLT